MKWTLALFALLACFSLYGVRAPSGVGALSVAKQQTAVARPAGMDGMMKDIETLCADPGSAGCIQALNRIEPCNSATASSDARTVADSGQKTAEPACF